MAAADGVGTLERSPRLRRGRVGWVMLMVAVVVASSVALIWVKRADDSYGPINFGSFAGPGVQSHIVSDAGEGFGPFRLTTTGSQTAFLYSSMRNDGDHTVKITGIDTDDVTIRAQWAPLPSSGEVAIPQADAAWHSFPAILGSEDIQIRYTIRRPPQCHGRPTVKGQGIFYSDVHVVHWESLVSSHTTRVGDDTFTGELQLC